MTLHKIRWYVYHFYVYLKRLLPQDPRPRLPLLFVHVPKTAGTSFREAARSSTSVNNVYCDYDPENRTTSWIILQTYYNAANNYSISDVLKSSKSSVLTGHFSLGKHIEHFYPYQAIMFVRDPVQRVVSHYHHRIREGQFSGTFEDYIVNGEDQNTQNKYLSHMSPYLFGFIGISEKYEESVEIINQIYGLNIQILEKNINPEKISESYSITEEQTALILEVNKEDALLYKTALQLFQQKIETLEVSDEPLYGAYSVDDSRKYISGWAYRAFSDEVITIEVRVNGRLVKLIQSTEKRKFPLVMKKPQDGSVGFSLELSAPLKSGDKLEVLEHSKGEVLIEESTPSL